MLYRCCDGRRIGGRRCPSTKKPAAPNAAGFEADTAGTGGLAFAGGKGRPHPPFVAAGGIACGAAGPCALLAHRVPQVTSAGRNLITLFSGVNNLSRSFSTPRVRYVQPMARMRRQCMRAARRCDAHRCSSDRLHASIGAACSDTAMASTLHARAMSRIARRACTTSAAKARIPHRRHRISRRTNAFARKVRELFRTDAPSRCRASGQAAAAWPHRHLPMQARKTRGVSAAGLREHRLREAQWSSLSSSSAYSSGPSSSLSCSASATSTTNSQPSP